MPRRPLLTPDRWKSIPEFSACQVAGVRQQDASEEGGKLVGFREATWNGGIVQPMATLILLVLKISIALNVLAIGLTASFSDATYLFRRPEHLVRAVLSMNVLMPIIALIMVLRLDVHPAVKIAIGVLAISPVPPMFPKQALKAGGAADYTVGLLVATTLLAIVVVPVTMEIYERAMGIPLGMPARQVALLVFTTVLAPLLAGIAVRAMWPGLAESAATRLAIVAVVLLVVSVIPVLFIATRAMLSLIGNGTLLVLAVFAVTGLLIGHLLGGPEPENRRVLSLATATRHPGIAVSIAQANFPEQKLAIPAIVLYLIVCGIVSALVARRRTRAGKINTTGQKKAA